MGWRSRCICMIRLQRHIGAVARIGATPSPVFDDVDAAVVVVPVFDVDDVRGGAVAGVDVGVNVSVNKLQNMSKS